MKTKTLESKLNEISRGFSLTRSDMSDVARMLRRAYNLGRLHGRMEHDEDFRYSLGRPRKDRRTPAEKAADKKRYVPTINQLTKSNPFLVLCEGGIF